MLSVKFEWPKSKEDNDAVIKALVAHRENFGYDLNYRGELTAGYTKTMEVDFENDVELGFFLLNYGRLHVLS